MSKPKTFTRPHKVRFAECDPAGIVFYPRYFEMINEVEEDFYEKIGFDYKTLHIEEKKGVPTVHMEVNFNEASKLGDFLTFSLNVKKIGTSSITLVIQCKCGSSPRFSMDCVLVYIDLTTMKSLPLPEAMRDKLTEYLLVGDE